MKPDVAALADALALLDSPEGLYPVAARAQAIAASGSEAGALIVAHAILLVLAGAVDDQLTADQWAKVREICVRLADFIRAPDIANLDRIGSAWLDLRRPAALH